jgi:hypothetical protein
MDNLRLRRTESVKGCDQPGTVAERELRSFVGSVIDLFGSEGTKFLEDIWLDELAEMEGMPEPSSSHWRLVSIAASSRLADRLIDLNNHGRSCF